MLGWRDRATTVALDNPIVSIRLPGSGPRGQASVAARCVPGLSVGEDPPQAPTLIPSAGNSAPLSWLSLKVIASGRLSRTTPAKPGPFLHPPPTSQAFLCLCFVQGYLPL